MIEKPFQEWRHGQLMYNFLAWLTDKEYTVGTVTIGDPFYIKDEDMEKYYQEFLDFYKSKNLS